MNAQGGSLLIGVADDGNIVGLDNDYQTLQRKDSDGYTQALMSTVADKLGTPACRLLRILFHRQDGKEVCCSASLSPRLELRNVRCWRDWPQASIAASVRRLSGRFPANRPDAKQAAKAVGTYRPSSRRDQ
jgi:hypothetical protein